MLTKVLFLSLSKNLTFALRQMDGEMFGLHFYQKAVQIVGEERRLEGAALRGLVMQHLVL